MGWSGNAVVVGRTVFSGELAALRVRRDGGSVAFEPGQFVTVGLPPAEAGNRARLVRRAYSIASPADGGEELELLIERVPGGRLSPRLVALSAGDRVWVDGDARGELTLDGVPTEAAVLMVGSRTGVAPFASMLRTYAGSGRWRRCTLVQVVERSADLAWAEEWRRLATAEAGFAYEPIVTSAAGETAAARVGRLLEPGGEASVDVERVRVLLAGDPGLIEAVLAVVERRGLRRRTPLAAGEVWVERYW